jgi:hypothetical protein
VKLAPPRDEKESMLEEIEESERTEQAVEGRLMLSPWLPISIFWCSIICAEGVRGGGDTLVEERGIDTTRCEDWPVVTTSDTSIVGTGILYGSVVTDCLAGRVLLTLYGCCLGGLTGRDATLICGSGVLGAPSSR